jgi:hypothetical protein
MDIRKITISALFFMLSIFVTWLTLDAAQTTTPAVPRSYTSIICIETERAISSGQQALRETR